VNPKEIIAATYASVLPGKFHSPEATVLLHAIGLQESRFEHRKQIGGPAVGFWQFEKGGGVRGVLEYPSTARHAKAVCTLRGVDASAEAVYAALTYDDLLACAFARLLLYTDPSPLPSIGAVDWAWDCYIRNWRPGKPHRHTWDALYAEAIA
jgi:hypothetical protein